ncbi:Trifunctional nucleotide phosphoesterase protein YfkN precursor [Roseivivax jejudonensis]|uniref:Trifunctional nucleotide phosphoesterase protein YfkN n=1 Tax=Roseivivax jejudonensis TaxID=1529041 RepID=A0A1X6ZJ94_9RHOB|nr:5'-nucleotidase C-terminal domain-containing protein [Roseivivax jejudonensis]SLN52770.1 Trifunctional nucleotide phosphoesterase protein YfkN precursor [Roseivivax jejudonensis]
MEDAFRQAGGARTNVAESVVSLRVLATSDLHMHLYPHDYHADRPDDSRGLAALARVIQAASAGADNCLLVDNGDLIQGSPMGDTAAEAVANDPDRPHPAIAALNRLGYDVATLGNHEFDFGLDAVERIYAQAAFPVVLANVARSAPDGGGPVFPAFAVIERDVVTKCGGTVPLRIGITGFAPPETTIWNRAKLEERVVTESILDSARRTVPRMREAGCDIVIALCHAGTSGADAAGESDRAARELAAVTGIDVVVAGHSHERFPGPDDCGSGLIAGTPVVVPGCHGSDLGQIDLTLARASDGRWHCRDSTVRLRPADAPVGPAPESWTDSKASYARVLNAVFDDHVRTLSRMRRPLGTLDHPVTTYFAAAGDYRAAGLVAWALRRHILRVAPVGSLDHGPLLVSTTTYPAGARRGAEGYLDIPRGRLRMRHVNELYPFANMLVLRRVRGAELRAWLERSAACYETVAPGARDLPLLAPTTPLYDLEIIDGLTWQIDLSRPPGTGRVRYLCHRGQPIGDDEPFTLALNDYRDSGSGGFCAPRSGPALHHFDMPVPEILADILSHPGARPPDRPAPWRFAPMPDATVVLDTGASARSHRIRGLQLGLIDVGGPAPPGFARFRKTMS